MYNFIKIFISGVIILLSNDLLGMEQHFPEFSKISIANLAQSIESQILENRSLLNNLSDRVALISWETLIQPLEDSSAKLENLVNIAAHLNSVKDSPELREVYPKILADLTKLNVDFLQNNQLYSKILQLSKTKEFLKLTRVQQKIIKDLLLSFKLSGIELTIEQKSRFKAITEELSKLSDDFSKNVLDSTQSWHYYLDKHQFKDLVGLPEYFLKNAEINAKKHGNKSGWLLNLDQSSVDQILKYAKNRELRKIIYRAYITRASEQFTSDSQHKYDNTNIMQEIIKLRHELASLLGFKNYSEYSLVHKVAKNSQEVIDFLNSLTEHSIPAATKEFAELKNFANNIDQITQLQPWDVPYYAELYKKQRFNFSSQELRNYFSLDRVLAGIFKLANTLYDIQIEAVHDPDLWDPEVKLYKVIDQDGLTGYFYMDLYERSNKKSGAWMGSCRSRHQWSDGSLQLPVAFLVTNFAKNSGTEQLLEYGDVVTLLHEFGHVLHHVLTKVNYFSSSGCNGVEWDAVELPSQFMEKWSYDWDFLQDVALHRDTKQKLSAEQYQNIIGIKNYNSGLFMIRQLEFGLFDFNLHLWSPVPPLLLPNIQQTLDKVRSEIAVVPVAPFNRFQHSFSHIFAGGYAAGYYSYNWAEVLASDAYMAFHEYSSGDPEHLKKQLGRKFLTNILHMGSSQEAMDLYLNFRGKHPSVKALLQDKGLLTNYEH